MLRRVCLVFRALEGSDRNSVNSVEKEGAGISLARERSAFMLMLDINRLGSADQARVPTRRKSAASGYILPSLNHVNLG